VTLGERITDRRDDLRQHARGQHHVEPDAVTAAAAAETRRWRVERRADARVDLGRGRLGHRPPSNGLGHAGQIRRGVAAHGERVLHPLPAHGPQQCPSVDVRQVHLAKAAGRLREPLKVQVVAIPGSEHAQPGRRPAVRGQQPFDLPAVRRVELPLLARGEVELRLGPRDRVGGAVGHASNCRPGPGSSPRRRIRLTMDAVLPTARRKVPPCRSTTGPASTRGFFTRSTTIGSRRSRAR
jgi:hypothetical protein